MILPAPTDEKRRRITRPVVSDVDGTQQGGLAFCVSVIGGSIVAATLAPGALTSFWVWFVLLTASVSIALGTQKLFALASKEPEE